MATVKPSADLGDDGIPWPAPTGAATYWQATNTYDDASYWQSATSGNQREYVTLSGTVDSSIDARTEFLNIRLRAATGPLAAGSILAIGIFADDGKITVMANIDLSDVAKAPAAFTDFSIAPVDNWSASGASSKSLRVTLVPGAGNAKKIDISYLSFGTAEAAATDYPQAGGAGVTMTGSAVVSRGQAPATVGASVTVVGQQANSLPQVGHSQMNSYFFLPPGATVGIIDDGNPYQGWGTKPKK